MAEKGQELVFFRFLLHIIGKLSLKGRIVKLKITLFFLLIICAGCSPIREEMSSWKGAKLDDLIARMGPPSSVSTVQDGIRYYSWFEDRGAAYTYDGLTPLSCNRTFGADEKETIVSWKWSGSCVASPDSKWHRLQQPQESN